VEFRLLGPLEVWHEGRAIELRGAKQRALLAVLLLNANQVVSSDRLVEELWGDEPPDARTAALRVRLSQLRKALEAGGSPIVTRAPGYAIELRPEQLDLRRFELLLDEAAAGDPSTAAGKLREALALWRGPALADFAYESFAQAAIGRLEELRLLALERRIEADLALGRHDELVPELEQLVRDHPLHEHLRVQLMLALYRAGRQADALESYHAARRTLVDELGIEPSPALQELERAILRQDPALGLAPLRAPQRSILVAAFADANLEPLLGVAEPLARQPPRELIVARLVEGQDRLAAAVAEVKAEVGLLGARGAVARAAVFTSGSPGSDAARLASEQDVDLVLVSAPTELLRDPDLGALLLAAPCDVAVVAGPAPAGGPVLVPFAGTAHDWSAIELGAWLAGSWQVPLHLAGPAVEGGRDASRLLASASLAVQRALGVAAEPLLVEPGANALVAAAEHTAVAIVGLPDRWRKDGLGQTRGALVRSGHPTLLVRKGLRPGGLAPAENLTRFTWSLRG
jgi:DNA-binding SARP family transcriptional activator